MDGKNIYCDFFLLSLIDSCDNSVVEEAHFICDRWLSKQKIMKPELYLDKRSPPVRSILLLIEAFGIEIQEKPIDLAKGEHLSESFLKVSLLKIDWEYFTQIQIQFNSNQINPLHTVPTFRDSSVTLTDSHAILIYLCETYGKSDNFLWPSDPLERINVLNKLFYSGTLLFRRDSDAIVSSFFA